MNLLITGGAGFIGSNFIHYWFHKYPNDNIVNLDLLTYAGNLKNLKKIETNPNYTFIKADICNLQNNIEVLKKYKIDVIINFAAESHNGRAMIEPDIFVKTNVLGTQLLLEAAKRVGVSRFHHISTCEVFGDMDLDQPKDQAFKETDCFAPKTPYNASKAAANHEVMAYFYTYKLPVTISHCSNNYGFYQFPEKLIPRFTINAIQNKKLPLFKSSKNKREWLHTQDHCKAIDLIIQKGKVGESYNIGSGIEKNIEEIANIILSYLNKPKSLKIYVQDRPGHDRRYLLNCKKIQNELNWKPEIQFEKGIKDTIDWYVQNKTWWEPLLNKGFIEEYKVIKK